MRIKLQIWLLGMSASLLNVCVCLLLRLASSKHGSKPSFYISGALLIHSASWAVLVILAVIRYYTCQFPMSLTVPRTAFVADALAMFVPLITTAAANPS